MKSKISELGDDLIWHCLSFLDSYSLARTSLVNTQFNEVAKDEDLWQAQCYMYWGKELTEEKISKKKKKYPTYKQLCLKFRHLRYDGVYVMRSIWYVAKEPGFGLERKGPREKYAKHVRWRYVRFYLDKTCTYRSTVKKPSECLQDIRKYNEETYLGRYSVHKKSIELFIEGHLDLHIFLKFKKKIENPNITGIRIKDRLEVLKFTALDRFGEIIKLRNNQGGKDDFLFYPFCDWKRDPLLWDEAEQNIQNFRSLVTNVILIAPLDRFGAIIKLRNNQGA